MYIHFAYNIKHLFKYWISVISQEYKFKYIKSRSFIFFKRVIISIYDCFNLTPKSISIFFSYYDCYV
jgi:hypothetical protein